MYPKADPYPLCLKRALIKFLQQQAHVTCRQGVGIGIELRTDAAGIGRQVIVSQVVIKRLPGCIVADGSSAAGPAGCRHP